MLRKHHQMAQNLFMLSDLLGVVVLWILSYCFVFEAPLKPWAMLFEDESLQSAVWELWPDYRFRLPIGIGFAFLAFQICRFYRPRRGESIWLEIPDLIKGCFLWALFLSVYGYWESPQQQAAPLFSRKFVILLSTSLFIWIVFVHVAGRSLLRKLRRRGYNLRYVLIVGAGHLGQQVCERIHRNRWMGLKVVGYLDEDPKLQESLVGDIPVLGSYDRINEMIVEKKIDQIYVALPHHRQDRLHDVMEALSVATVDVRVIPDLTDFVTLRMSVGDLDGLPLITLQETPLVGWNRVVKRIFDIVVGLFCLFVFALPMLMVALLIKLTSKGPVFYLQERMGIDGRVFKIIKFRSMRVDAEKQTGAVWAQKDDSRRTRLGQFLRSTNLDELPQLFNVLKGEMSLVGPRPERPVFINDFKKKIPRYMLRHRMKSGMTGWAQVNGWRGNTSLEKRIQCDLYYIENWSLWLDIQIMFMQIFSWRDQNAY